MKLEIVREMLHHGAIMVGTRDQGFDNFIIQVRARIKRSCGSLTGISFKTTVNKIYYKSNHDDAVDFVEAVSREIRYLDSDFEKQIQRMDNLLSSDIPEFAALSDISRKIKHYKNKTCWRNIKGIFTVSEDFAKLDRDVLENYKFLTDNDISTKGLVKEVKRQVESLLETNSYSEFERLTSNQMKLILMLVAGKLNIDKEWEMLW